LYVFISPQYAVGVRLSSNKIKQEYRYCDKKLARFLFDFGVIAQLLSTRRTMIVNSLFRPSRSVDNSCGLTPSRTAGRIDI